MCPAKPQEFFSCSGGGKVVESMSHAIEKSRISPTSLVKASDQQISTTRNGETAILNLRTGTYYGLDLVGVTVWELLAQQRRVSEMRDRLLEIYDVDATRCSNDLIALLSELAEQGLIEVIDESVA